MAEELLRKGPRMTAATKKIVFDSHAILKWTQMESGYKKVKSLLKSCQDGTLTGFISQINLGEVYYKSIRAVGIERARQFLDNFEGCRHHFRSGQRPDLEGPEKSRPNFQFPMPSALRWRPPSGWTRRS